MAVSNFALGDLQGQIDSINAHLGDLLKYMDINITNDVGTQINSASGSVINWTNFVSAFVIGTNSVVAVIYTYSNLVYVRLKNVETMANVTAGNYTVRVWYKGA